MVLKIKFKNDMLYRETFNENQSFVTQQLDPISKIWHMRLSLSRISEQASNLIQKIRLRKIFDMNNDY